MVVDFPAPLGPRNAWTSPALTVRSTPLRAFVWPNVLNSSRNATNSLVVFKQHKVFDVCMPQKRIRASIY